ncbi:MAG: hypothetical protein J7L14_00245 [Candidatus Diapherotrites archaeon]|nr:hypothetical protein [Candidatus Diapherotrites archaeon]
MKLNATAKIIFFFVALFALALLVFHYAGIERITINRTQETKFFPLNVVEIVAEDCRICQRHNVFLSLLNKSNIKIYFQEVSYKSERGKQLIELLNITELPAVIIEENELDDNMYIYRSGKAYPLRWILDNYALHRETFYIVYPKEFDRSASVSLLIDENALQDCDANTLRIDIFADPFAESTIRSAALLLGLQKKFGKNYFDYYFVAATDSNVPVEMRRTAASFWHCAAEQYKLPEFQLFFYAVLCDALDKNYDEFKQILKSCQAKRFSTNDLYAITNTLDLNNQQFFDCLYEKGKFFSKSKKKAELFHIKFFPMAVINCKYKMPIAAIDRAICSIASLPPCRAAKENKSNV